ncbi:MAG: sulfurtransferase [Dehalococcoidia bacterium]
MPAGWDLLVSTEWLAANLDGAGRDFVLIDAGEAVAYRRAHIPGAVGVSHPYLKARDDRGHVMPPAEFEELAASLGVSNDTPVVIYDDNASLHAARVWWVFDYYGHRDLRVVDGGFNAWLDEGRPLTSLAPRPPRGRFVAQPNAAAVCVLDELKAAVEGGAAPQIWDLRSDGEWTGVELRGNQRGGHVPGARHLEWRGLMQGPPARRFRPREEIAAMLREAGIDPAAPTVTYCELGIRAAFGAFVMRLLGNEAARNYDGSMNEWANRPDTPLTTDS